VWTAQIRGIEGERNESNEIYGGLCAVAFLAAMPVVAQTDANKPKEPRNRL